MNLTPIKLIGAELEDGQTYRGQCPECHRKDTFTITRQDDSLVWNCYRASCSVAGALGVRRAVPDLLHNKRQPRKAKHTPYDGELTYLPEEWEVYLGTVVGFDPSHLQVARAMFAPVEHRVAYPIFGPMGVRRGWSLRTYSYGVEPKALTRMDVEEPHLAWYRPRPADSKVLIVEDIPSAVRAARYMPQVVAMNGSGMGPDYVHEVAQYAHHVVWAFDQDATASALKHHKRYSLFFTTSQVMPLGKDLKDMKEEDLCQLLTNCC